MGSRKLAALLCVSAALGLACRGAPQPAPVAQAAPTVQRELGSWRGKGNTTLGFVSESGSFRTLWKTTNLDAVRPGTFQLTLRSGISGRPLKILADQQGEGSGSVEFGDDPRMYEFLVESSGIEWEVLVQETFAPRK